MLNTIMDENEKKLPDFPAMDIRENSDLFLQDTLKTDLDENEILAVEDDMNADLDMAEDEVLDTDISYDGFTNDGTAMYLRQIGEKPLLTAEEEYFLGYKIKHGTPEEKRYAKNELVSRNLRYVVTVARRYIHSGLSMDDLIQEGNIGLMKAAERYDAESGYRFSTYATWWIRQGITRAISDKSRAIRLPVHLWEKIKIIRRIQANYEASGKNATLEDIAAELNMEAAKVDELLTLSRDVVSMDLPVGEEEDSTLGDFIPDKNTYDPEDSTLQNDLLESLEKAMTCLSAREKNIIIERFGLYGKKAKTLEEIGTEMGVTRERVRQIEMKALRKLKNPKRSIYLRSYLLP